jgi:Zn-dependent protease
MSDSDDPADQGLPAPQPAPPARYVTPIRLPGTYNVLVEQGLPPSAAPIEPLPPRPRRVRLPIILFVLTCFSTFFTGLTFWQPELYLFGPHDATAAVVAALAEGWSSPALQNGLTYMLAVVGILLAHEMGHFVMTLRYKIPASLPFFIPVPIMPFGTMGAVIGMDGRRADRKAMFDTGLAGPLAGLVIALPVLWFGIQRAEFEPLKRDQPHYHDPLLVELMVPMFHSEDDIREDLERNAGNRNVVDDQGNIVVPYAVKLNPFYFAGWVGLLITGLNMMPISQLDGGHVTYALFGKRAHLIARAFLIIAIIYIIVANANIWTVMLVLVILIGVDHPPTADDTAELGWPRKLIGCASLAIPILCFPPQGVTM